jgi:dsDNA-specific endonuclease/ATPase MutS2
MTQLRIKELLGRANLILDKGFHFLPGYVMIKSSDMEAILDRIDASVPEDVKEAESILRRREEIQIEAQQRAERIIVDARNEADKILSESELLNQVQREAEKIKEQVRTECQDLRDRTIEEAKQIKIQADDEAHRIKEGAENYAEQILNNIDGDLTQLHQIVKNGQLYLEKLKTSSVTSNAYMQQQYEQDEYAATNYPM